MTYKHSIIALSVLSSALVLTGCQTVDNIKSTAKTALHMSSHGIDQTKTSYANARSLTIDGADLPVYETSARLLTTTSGNEPELVADIFDGKADKAVAGYKIMVINRTSSLLAEARKTERGIIDNRMLHRGAKALIGIPVVSGKAQLDKAVLLDLDVIYDDPSLPVPEGKNVKDRGQKLTKKDVAVNDKKVVIRSLTLPNYQSGESSGGGIDFEASATIEGKTVKTSANSAFQIFYTAKSDVARGF